MTVITQEYGELFTPQEQKDIVNCAKERGVSISELIHDCVLDDLAR